MYLPKSKYTVIMVKPGEYQLNGTTYTGPAILLSDGTAYAGNNIETAKDVLERTNQQEFSNTEIYQVVPIKREPSYQEYSDGYMERYFCQDLRTMKVFETSKTYYTKLVENVKLQSIYRTVTINWILTGPTAEATNEKTIQKLDSELPGIVSSKILYNPLQFVWRNS
mgnify:CR=1 FL=1